MNLMAKKKLGADLSPKVVDDFNDWCDANTLNRGGVITAGLRLIRELPVGLRVLVLSGQWQAVQAWLVKGETAADVELSATELQSISQGLRQGSQGRKAKAGGGVA